MPGDGLEDRVLVAAEHGGHPGPLGRRRRRHRRGAHRDQAHRVVRVQHAGNDPGRQFPDAVSRGRVGGNLARGPARQFPRRDERGAQQQRLGDRRVPDLVGARGGTAPDQVAARQFGGGTKAFGDTGQLQPRGQETRRLRALPGCGDDQHPPTLPCRSPPFACRMVRSCPSEACCFHTNNVHSDVIVASPPASSRPPPAADAPRCAEELGEERTGGRRTANRDEISRSCRPGGPVR